MRVRLKGLASATKLLADGSRKTYYYAWRGGPKLDGEPGTPEFMASYNAAVATRRLPSSGMFHKLIDVYLDSTEFRDGLAERTKTDYRKLVARIRAKFGTMPLAAIEDRRARGVFKAWRDEIAVKAPRQADYLWTVLARMLSIAKDRGLIAVNPCEKAAAFTSQIGQRSFGQPLTLRLFAQKHRRNFSSLYYWLCGLARGKAIC